MTEVTTELKNYDNEEDDVELNHHPKIRTAMLSWIHSQRFVQLTLGDKEIGKYPWGDLQAAFRVYAGKKYATQMNLSEYGNPQGINIELLKKFLSAIMDENIDNCNKSIFATLIPDFLQHYKWEEMDVILVVLEAMEICRTFRPYFMQIIEQIPFTVKSLPKFSAAAKSQTLNEFFDEQGFNKDINETLQLMAEMYSDKNPNVIPSVSVLTHMLQDRFKVITRRGEMKLRSSDGVVAILQDFKKSKSSSKWGNGPVAINVIKNAIKTAALRIKNTDLSLELRLRIAFLVAWEEFFDDILIAPERIISSSTKMYLAMIVYQSNADNKDTIATTTSNIRKVIEANAFQCAHLTDLLTLMINDDLDKNATVLPAPKDLIIFVGNKLNGQMLFDGKADKDWIWIRLFVKWLYIVHKHDKDDSQKIASIVYAQNEGPATNLFRRARNILDYFVYETRVPIPAPFDDLLHQELFPMKWSFLN